MKPEPRQFETVDIAVIGAGAAGLMASIWAGRAAAAQGGHRPSILAVDGAKKPGAKILVAGGGRCNVTHHHVDESSYNGSSRNAIKKVLRAFDVTQTTDFFLELGVILKREETGKLFPTTDDAHTVLNALTREVERHRIPLLHPWRVQSVVVDAENSDFPFLITRDDPAETIRARRVVLATGGKALPRSGSDGLGLDIARSLGHTVTSHVFPALVPITLDPARTFIPTLSGLTIPATIGVRSGTGKKIIDFTGSTLCTHFGLSGPAVLDASRHYLDARHQDSGATLVLNWLIVDNKPATPEWADESLRTLGPTSPVKFITRFMPDRLARAICEHVQVDPSAPGHTLTKEKRRSLADALTRMPMPVTGDRGFTFAEATAGGVPLSELRLETMESRIVPGLHLCGEICDVDGRIGGFNFQWAWASGYLAGRAAVELLRGQTAAT
jgi:predicted Rossmann fold flavoprotein